ncbi:MAG TPA: hypothetical protein VND90_02010 [Terracidiphilus sp.]|nr:hypothetical protein [Terracidiphilus sp.]
MNPEAKNPTAENPPQADDSTCKPPAKGAEEMRLAADKVLKQNCTEIAQALVNSSIEGHIQSARFLYFLAEGQQKLEAAQVVETLHSLAIELAQQPEWSEPAKTETLNPAGDASQPQG